MLSTKIHFAPGNPLLVSREFPLSLCTIFPSATRYSYCSLSCWFFWAEINHMEAVYHNGLSSQFIQFEILCKYNVDKGAQENVIYESTYWPKVLDALLPKLWSWAILEINLFAISNIQPPKEEIRRFRIQFIWRNIVLHTLCSRDIL